MVDTCVAYPSLADNFTPVPSPFTGRAPIFKALKYFLKGSAMTENLEPKKPTWFELTDGDAPSAQVTKVNKKLPAIAVLVTGAVIASGAFFANASSSEKTGSSTASTSISQVDNSTASTTGATGDTSEISNTQPAGVKNSDPAIATVNNNIQDPTLGGMKAPGGRDNDEEDEDNDDDNHEDRERKGHERGEGRERGEH